MYSMRSTSVLLMLIALFSLSGTVFAAEQPITSNDDLCQDTVISPPARGQTKPVLTSGARRVEDPAQCKESELCKDGKPVDPSKVGTITYSSADGRKETVISKCDPRYKQTKARLSAGEDARSVLRDLAVQNLARSAITPGLPDKALSDLLAKNFNLNGAQADELVRSRRDDVLDLLQKQAGGDAEGAAAAARSLGLNEDLSRNIARLSPAQLLKTFDSVLSQDDMRTASTFGVYPTGSLADLVERSKPAIAAIESGGRYNIIGACSRGDCPYGKYQVMGRNIPSWTRRALGYSMTPQQFLNSPEAQEKVFETVFGGYIQKYGNPESAAAVWFGGPGALRNGGARDILGTSVYSYTRRFSQLFNGGIPGNVANHAGVPSGSPFRFVGSAPGSGLAGLFRTVPIGQPTTVGVPAGGSGIGGILGRLFGGGGSSGGGSSGSGFSSSGGSPFESDDDNDSRVEDPRPAPAIASVILQNRTVRRGEDIVLAWSSVGVRSSPSCVVTMEADEGRITLSDSTNEGVKTIETDAMDPGVVVFAVSCVAQSTGERIEDEAALELL